MRDPRKLSQMLAGYADELDRKQAIIDSQNTTITAITPKAEYCDKVLSSGDAVPTTIIAKEYGMSATKLNKILKDYGIQYKVNDMWVLTQDYVNSGYTKSKTSMANGRVVMSTLWTQSGRNFIYNTLKEKMNITPSIIK